MSTIYYIIFITILFTFLLRNKRTFTNSYDGLSSKQKVTAWTIFVITFLPALCFIVYILYTAYIVNPSEHWYKVAQSKTPYHIYRSTFPPSGKQQTSLYMTATLAGLPNATRIIYDRNIFQPKGKEESGPIIVYEVGVPPEFDEKAFIRSQLSSLTERKVEVTTAADGTGIFLEKPATNSASLAVAHLIFRTADNVLIQISALKNTDTNLIQIANTLK
jgi:hypothetical protein